jgi:PAS domain S-box-containing protein
MPGDQELRDRIASIESELARCSAERDQARKAEEQFRLFLNSLKDYALITLDSEHQIVGWSPGAEQIVGYSVDEILGKPGDIVFTPEDRTSGRVANELTTALKNGFAEDERWLVRKDGSRFWASGVITPAFDPTGNLRGYIKVFRDQTARKMSEERLRQSEERFRLFSENVIDYALIPLDSDGNVSGWNTGAQRIFGYSEDEIVGRSAGQFFTRQDILGGEPEWDLSEAVARGRSEMERWMVRKDGTRFWARWVTTPMRDEHGTLLGYARVLRDETERKEAEEEWARFEAREREALRNKVRSTGEALDRSKEELRALAASLIKAQEEERRRIARELHDDLNQQLAVLGLGLARLGRESADPETFRSELKRLEQLAACISDDLRRLSHQLHPSIIYHLGLPAALRNLIEEFQRGRSAPVTFEAGQFQHELPADVAAAIYRITQEALHNIAKHAPEAPVAVTLVPEGPELRLTIEDKGPGFHPEEARGRGGLGIISMKERTQILGGTFTIYSERGTGTRIDVRVPFSNMSRSVRERH